MFRKHVNLKPFTTFGIDSYAELFATFSDLNTLQSLLDQSAGNQLTILGGGSNLLLTNDIQGLVLKNEILGVEVAEETSKLYY